MNMCVENLSIAYVAHYWNADHTNKETYILTLWNYHVLSLWYLFKYTIGKTGKKYKILGVMFKFKDIQNNQVFYTSESQQSVIKTIAR